MHARNVHDRRGADNPKGFSASAIIEGLGGNSGNGMCRCPAHDDENPSLHVTQKGDRVLVKCHAGCSQEQVIHALRARGLWPPVGNRGFKPHREYGRAREAMSDANDLEFEEYERFRRAFAILRAVANADLAKPLKRPIDYLKGRGIDVMPKGALVVPPGVLRKIGCVHHCNFPAMVLPLVDHDYKLRGVDHDYKLRGAQLTFLTRDGKQNLRVEGKSLRTTYGIRKGAYVVLSDPDPNKPLVIAEGVETGLAVTQITGLPAIATLGKASNLVLPPCSEIILAADNDKSGGGLEYAEEMARTFADASRPIRIAMPERPEGKQKFDWNDALIDKGADLQDLRDQIINAKEYTEEDGGEAKARQHQDGSQADQLVGIAEREAVVFHSADGIAYADIDFGDRRETWPIKSSGFRLWLLRRYFEETDKAPNSESLRSALNIVEAKARFGSPVREVFTRVAVDGDRLYLDLCNEQWEVVEITPDGWRVISDPPVRFLRRRGMLPLPAPTKGGSIADLRRYVNVATDADFILVVAWLLATLSGGPYPVLALAGEQGSAKSTLMRLLRALIDPNKAPLRAPPRENRDLFIAAKNGHVIALDNLSHLPEWLSDTLCRLSTGGGFGTRELYSDEDEQLFDAMRPGELSAIEDIVSRPDLADRSIFLTLHTIADAERRTEKELWADFDHDRPRVLGALLDAAAHGLRALPNTKLDRMPRMADFARWITACEGALWEPGTFLRAYEANRGDAVAQVLDADLVAVALRAFMEERQQWVGTAAELLGLLDHVVDERQRVGKHWPSAPNVLSGRLRRVAPLLRKQGIEIRSGERERNRKKRLIVITKAARRAATSSQPSSSSFSNDNKGLDDDDRDDGRDDERVTRKPLKNKGNDDRDDRDDVAARTTGAGSTQRSRFKWRSNRAAREARVRHAARTSERRGRS